MSTEASPARVVDLSRYGVIYPDMDLTLPLSNDFAEPVDVARRRDPAVRKSLSGPAMRTFFAIAKAWNLSVEEQRGLLGWPPASTFHKYKAGDVGQLNYDMLTRISLIIGIYKALHILYENGLADRWPKLPNSNAQYGGKPALTLMIESGIDGLYRTRRLLDTRRGAWN